MDVVSDILIASFWKNLGFVSWNHTPSPLRIPRGCIIGHIVLLKNEEPKLKFLIDVFIHTYVLLFLYTPHVI
jgi:hypothetical protein